MVKFELLCEKFNKLTNAPDKFLSGGSQLTDDFKNLLKNVYDFGQNQGRTSNKALPELIVKDFDDEQIWQELELQNEGSLPNLINKAASLLVSKNLQFPVETEIDHLPDDKYDRKKVKDKKVKKSEAISTDEESDENFDEEEMESDEMEDEELLKINKPKKVKIVPSEVDDDFFKLSEMEAFLKDQEEKGDNLGVDLFGGLPSDSDDEDERPKYNDFFEEDNEGYDDNREIEEEQDENDEEQDEFEDNGDDQIEENDEDQLSNKDKTKKVKFNLQPESQDESSSDDEPKKKKSNEIKSSFEIREERLRKKIAQLEDEALEDKAWPLKGEVNASVRPINSLLEEVVEFDMTKRPPPIITEESSNRLEDIIKQRVKDQAYDDVERKIKPVATPNEFKKKLVLDQEKSKLSLAEVYEKEYLKQKNDLNQDEDKPEVEPEEHQVIRKMMASLFNKLDALSNFFFVPKPLAPDLKIVSNVPAVNLEEVAPLAASGAKLLAPEEIGGSFRKSLVSKEEKTKTDKKRERRKKRVLQASKFKAKEIRDANKPASYDEQLKKVMKYKNVTKLDEHNKTSKSSTDFFSKLQDEVKKPQKGNEKKRKSKEPVKSAKKLKL